MSGVIVPFLEARGLGGVRVHGRGRQQLRIKCAACMEVIPELELLADPAHLEQHPAFVLCEPCYVHIRTGYQRDRDRRARASYAAGSILFTGKEGTDRG